MLIDTDPSPYSNWTKSDWTRPAVVVTPASVGEIVDIVIDPERYPSPVRAVGHRHSTNPCFSTNVLAGNDRPRGTLVLMMPRFSGVEIAPPGSAVEKPDVDVYVRAGAGARMIDIRDALRVRGRELAVSPEIGNATAGSVACGGTKDSTLRPREMENLSQISSLVVEVKFVDAQGNQIRVNADGVHLIGPRRGPLPTLDLHKFRSSYGLCGIVYEVTFRTIPLEPIVTRYHWVPFSGVNEQMQNPHFDETSITIQSVNEILGDAHTIDGFMQPYEGGMLVERRTKTPDARIEPNDTIRRALRDWMWEFGASQATSAAAAIAGLTADDPAPAFQQLMKIATETALASTADNPLKRALAATGGYTGADALAALRQVFGIAHGAMPTAAAAAQTLWRIARSDAGAQNQLLGMFGQAPALFFTALEGFTGYRSDSMIDFDSSESRATYFDFTFWAFPLDHWTETVAGYLKFCHDQYHASPTRFRPSLFTEVYFMGKDEMSLLSPCASGPMFTLDTVHSGPNDPGWKDFNKSYNEWAVTHRGRPLLNQTKQLERTPNVPREAFGPEAWETFRTMVSEADPHRRFLNDFFQRLIY